VSIAATASAAHNPTFHQIEGLYVDKGVTVGDLKGTVEFVFKELMGRDVRIDSGRTTSATGPSYEIGSERACQEDGQELAGDCRLRYGASEYSECRLRSPAWTGWAFGRD
jgi:phenylalanyl-tRNA synthetase alpha chain